MSNLRKYGNAPYRVAVVHGGPGGLGQVAPVARELSSFCGILEPLQTASSIDGQIEELHDILTKNSDLPVTLIGHSWGGMLSLLFASRHKSIVEKLILVSCGPLDPAFTSADVMKNRMERMSAQEKTEFDRLAEQLKSPDMNEKRAAFARLCQWATKVDSFEPIAHAEELIEPQYDIFETVWKEAENLRSAGGFVDAVKGIECPVLAIHGDYDPHPPHAIQSLLSRELRDFRFVLLERCGHYPWIEKQAHEAFFGILRNELRLPA